MEDFFGNQFTCHAPCELNPARTALLVVDMQYHDAHPDFGFNLAVERISPGSMSYFNRRNEEVTVPTIEALIKFFRENQMKIAYLTLGSDYADYRDWSPRMRKWILDLETSSGTSGIFWSGSSFFRIRDELKPVLGELVINKTTFGPFNSTNIEEQLRSRGVNSLVITGVSTSGCVETTARDAADRGFTCVLVDEGTCDYDAELHRSALRGFKFNFGDVLKDLREVKGALFREKSQEFARAEQA